MGIWKILILVAACAILYKLFVNEKKKKSGDDKTTKERKIATGELVKDPICGAYVEPESSVSVRDGNTVHRFCSYECRQKFLDGLDDRELPEGVKTKSKEEG